MAQNPTNELIGATISVEFLVTGSAPCICSVADPKDFVVVMTIAVCVWWWVKGLQSTWRLLGKMGLRDSDGKWQVVERLAAYWCGLLWLYLYEYAVQHYL